MDTIAGKQSIFFPRDNSPKSAGLVATRSEGPPRYTSRDRFTRQTTAVLELPDNAACTFIDKFSLWRFPSEPARTGLLATFVNSSVFQMSCSFVIFVNAITTSISADFDMAHLGSKSNEMSERIELAFLVFYALELILKLAVHRCFFFINDESLWNIFDFTLVLQGLIDAVMTQVLKTKGTNITFARMARLLKLGKIFRIFRAFRFLRDLRVMLASIVSSFISLLWSFVLLSVMLFMVALVFVQLQAGYLIELELAGDIPEELLFEVKKYFGSIGTSMLSLYQATTGGEDWGQLYNAISSEGWMSCFTMVFFIAFWQFSMLNVVTGLVMEKAVRNAAPDRDELMLEQRREQEESAQELKHLFAEMDSNGDATLSLDEFVDRFNDTKIKTYVNALGLSIQDAEMFFRMLTDISGTGQIFLEDFVEHCGHMKGYATAIDLHQLTFEVKQLRRELSDTGAVPTTNQKRKSGGTVLVK